MGRPTSFTPELANRVLEMVRNCVPKRTAAASAGIGRTTLHEWQKKGEAGEEPFVEFAAALEEAEALAEAKMVGIVYSASASDASHARWMLERRFAKRWAQRTKNETSATVKHEGAAIVYLPQNDRDDG